MRFLTLLLASTALAGSVIASVAQAAPFTPAMNRAYRMATEHWGGPPENCTSVDREIVLDRVLAAQAKSEGPAAGGHLYGLATIPDSPGPCILWVARSEAAPVNFEFACSTIEHESGHNHGLEHSTDPTDVMYKDVPVTPECRALGKSYFRIRELRDWLTVKGYGTDQRLRRELRAARRAFWG